MINFSRLEIQAEVKATKAEHMDELVKSETRIIILYSTRDEANNILGWAREKDLTGHNYVWIVTQSVIGENGKEKPKPKPKPQFPVGMLGRLNIVCFENNR